MTLTSSPDAPAGSASKDMSWEGGRIFLSLQARAVILLAVAVLLAGGMIGFALLRLAQAHSDLERACFQGGGNQYQPAQPESAQNVGGTCYHVL